MLPQRGASADAVDLDLIGGALLALLGLVRPLPQTAGDDDPHPADELHASSRIVSTMAADGVDRGRLVPRITRGLPRKVK